MRLHLNNEHFILRHCRTLDSSGYLSYLPGSSTSSKMAAVGMNPTLYSALSSSTFKLRQKTEIMKLLLSDLEKIKIMSPARRVCLLIHLWRLQKQNASSG